MKPKEKAQEIFNGTKPVLGVLVSDLSLRVIELPFYTEWDYPDKWGGGKDTIR
jgi:hypothetical protein